MRISEIRRKKRIGLGVEDLNRRTVKCKRI
jgi:hypothetical protein